MSGEMNFSACVKFAAENPVTYIATAEGDQPRVRAFAMWFADKTGFYYRTGTPKNMYRQTDKEPEGRALLLQTRRGSGNDDAGNREGRVPQR